MAYMSPLDESRYFLQNCGWLGCSAVLWTGGTVSDWRLCVLEC
jgi:hypothetical protein